MSMSTYVVGFVPPDDQWHKMRDVWNACEAAGIPVPEDVQTFFGHEDPDDRGREVSMDALEGLGAVRDWSGDFSRGYEVELAKLPPEIKVIRFYNSR